MENQAGPRRIALLAEALGVLLMMAVGGHVVLLGASLLWVAIAFGGAVAVLVVLLGPVSGAHFNPAVTVAFAAIGKFPWRSVVPYVAVQLVGAFVACLGLVALHGSLEPLVATPSITGGLAFVAEAAATWVLAFVIAAVATGRPVPRLVAGLAIGSAVAVGCLAAGPLSGAAMNPARAIAPALMAGRVGDLWLHVAAPLLGAVAGMATYRALRRILPKSGGSPPFRVLFACVGNSARSQMAHGFAKTLGGSAVEARSGGSRPLGHVLPEAVAAMAERGIDIASHPSQGFDEAWVRSSCDLVVTMGCGDDACPAFTGKPLVDWDLPDPKGQPIEAFRAVRDEIEGRVRRLLESKGITPKQLPTRR